MRVLKASMTFILSFLPVNKHLIAKRNRTGGGT